MDNHMDNNPNGNRPDNNKGPGRQDPNKNHQSILAFLVCLLVTLVCFAMFTNMLKDNSSEITYDKFIEMVDDGDVKEVTLQSNILTITPKHQSSGFSEEVYYANQMESVDKLTERLEGTGLLLRMWQGRMRLRNHCRRWWISCIIPANIPPSERSCRKELCL